MQEFKRHLDSWTLTLEVEMFTTLIMFNYVLVSCIKLLLPTSK